MRAYNALAKIAPESRQVAEALVEAFREGHPSVPQDQLCYALSDLRGHRDLLEPALIEAASGADTNLLSTIGFALDRIGATSPAAKEILKKRIQIDRLKYLEPIKKLSPVDLPQLIAGLKAGDHFEQVRVTSQLTQLTARLKAEAREAVPALTAYIQDSNHAARGNAVSALGNIGPAAKNAVPVLIEMLHDDDIGASQNTIHALGEIGPAARAALPKIRERFKNGDARARLSAAVALWRIEPATFDEVFPFLLKVLESKIPGLEYAEYFVSMVMAEMGPAAKAAVPALNRIASDHENSARLPATRALAKIDPPQAAAMLPGLLESLRDETSYGRPFIAETVGELGPRAKEAVPLLLAAQKSDDAQLRDAAIEALKKISPEVKP